MGAPRWSLCLGSMVALGSPKNFAILKIKPVKMCDFVCFPVKFFGKGGGGIDI